MAKKFIITVHDVVAIDDVPITISADDEISAIATVKSYNLGEIVSVEYIPTISPIKRIINFLKHTLQWKKTSN